MLCSVIVWRLWREAQELQAAEKDAADASTKRPVDEGAASRNANDVLMLRAQLRSLEEHSVIVNKSVLKTEKERDKLHKELDLMEVQLQGKRVRTHDDTGDGHDMHAEVDEWDLRDFRRETTRVQNRRHVALGSLHDQPKPHTGKDGFLLYVRLGLVGWIAYWCNGDSALAVDVVVALINMLDLKELGESPVSWTLLDLQVWDGSWYHELRREEVRVEDPEEGGVQGHQVLRRGQRSRR